MASAIEELKKQVKAAKAASRRLAYLSTEVKNQALLNIADSLVAETDKYWRLMNSIARQPRPQG